MVQATLQVIFLQDAALTSVSASLLCSAFHPARMPLRLCLSAVSMAFRQLVQLIECASDKLLSATSTIVSSNKTTPSVFGITSLHLTLLICCCRY